MYLNSIFLDRLLLFIVNFIYGRYFNVFFWFAVNIYIHFCLKQGKNKHQSHYYINHLHNNLSFNHNLRNKCNLNNHHNLTTNKQGGVFMFLCWIFVLSQHLCIVFISLPYFGAIFSSFIFLRHLSYPASCLMK